MSTMFDVLIIGAGQAGLAMGAELKARGLKNFLIVDETSRVGQSWEDRYDSLKLFTPAQYCNLPGMKFPLRRNRYPTKEQVADYLMSYAVKFSLPIQMNTKVNRLAKKPDSFVVETSHGSLRAAKVIIATGSQHTPWMPSFASQLSDSIFQIHSAQFKSPDQIPDGEVLVIGAGNSGVQIAEELSATRPIHMSIDRLPKQFPQRLMGKDIFWYLLKFGYMDVPVSKRNDGDQPMPLIGSDLKRLVKKKKLIKHARAVDADGNKVTMSDGTSFAPRTIIWATGFRNDYAWIDIADAHKDGVPIQADGCSPVQDLYWIGFSWLRTKGSGFLGFVGRDTKHLAPVVLETDD